MQPSKAVRGDGSVKKGREKGQEMRGGPDEKGEGSGKLEQGKSKKREERTTTHSRDRRKK